jgi:predicted house-cleaning noncanonical NTP pyrophosphatase (MazG superfamily)
MKGKLVRDRVPEIMKDAGKIPITRVAGTQEYKEALKNKLLEEVKEYIASGKLEEIADVLEVINCLVKAEGSDSETMEKIRKGKTEKRGSFEKGIILEGIEK